MKATGDASFDARDNHAAVAFKGEMWVVGGFDASLRSRNDIWHSKDGKNWTEATGGAKPPARYGHASAVSAVSGGPALGDKIWGIGGHDNSKRLNDVWSSTNGRDWTEATSSKAKFSPRSGHASVFFKDKIWVIGGSSFDGNPVILGDVRYSENGVTWKEATADAAFGKRYAHGAFVFDRKMWVIGGYDDSKKYKDVWHSEDGVTWTDATKDAAFTPRDSHAAVTLDNKMWVIGGRKGTGTNYDSFKDVWHSEDGVAWKEATDDALIKPGRIWHASTVFDGKIWIIGGIDGSYKNDVWYSP